MEKTLITIAAVASFSSVFSQNVVPDNGYVGLGTATPTVQLHVKGNVQIDSSLNINKHAAIGGTLDVSEKATLHKTAIAGPLEVQAPSIFLDSMVVESTITVNDILMSNATFIGNGKNDFNGVSTFNNTMKLNQVNWLANPAASYFLFMDGDGEVRKSDIPSFADGFATAIYSFPCLTDSAGNTLSPKWNNGTNKLYALCANVGIGTSTPRAKLDVIGKGQISQLAMGVDPASMTGAFHLRTNGFSTSSDAAIFRVENLAGRALFEINNQGFVQGREVIVEMDSVAWPDYVFKPDYKLSPLREVELFIKYNGHLPNVPSAAQMSSEGLSLGEMNRLLMEKIEELTLHLIAQEKCNEQQDALIVELQGKLNNK